MEGESLAAQPSHADKIRAGRQKWLGHVPGLTPEEADKFLSEMRDRHSVSALTTYGKRHICSVGRLETHCKLDPAFAAQVKELAKSTRYPVIEVCRRKGHPLTPDNVVTMNRSGRIGRACKICYKAAKKATRDRGNLTEPTVRRLFEAVETHGATVQSLVYKPAAARLGLQKLIDPARLYAFKRTQPELAGLLFDRARENLARHRQSNRIIRPVRQFSNLRDPTLTGIIAGPSDPVYSAAQAAVSFRLSYDMRQEAIALTVMDYLEGRIGIEGIAAAARRHSGKLYSEERYRRSLDAPIYEDGSLTLLDRLSTEAGAGFWEIGMTISTGRRK